METITDLIQILTLEKIEANTFNGVSKNIGSPNVFGGQVVAQALHAAYHTVSKTRIANSLHSYFLEPGDLTRPITYTVAIIRDGGSFSTRRITATQGDKTIFIMAASFHKKEEGHEHQTAIKEGIKQPEYLLSWDEMLVQYGDFLPKQTKAFLSIPRPIEFKPAYIVNPLDKKDHEPVLDVWFRLKGTIPESSLALKQQILSYISDYNILAPTLYPNNSKANFGNTQMASLDHAMWFYRDFDYVNWMLFSIESPSSYGARGFSRGNIFTRTGTLI